MSEPIKHRDVRVGTIVWGAILVGVAVFSLLIILNGPLTAAGALWSIVGFGAALVLVAIVASIVRTARKPKALRAADADEDQPIG
jgi:multisubunit Na+/H+ antiporter MnhB subunit